MGACQGDIWPVHLGHAPPHPSVSSTLGKLNPGTGFDLLLRWSKLERLLVGPGASERGPEP